MSALIPRKKYWIKASCLLSTLLLTAQVSVASKYEDNIDEYKAPNGGWKIVKTVNLKKIKAGLDSGVTLKAVSPAGKEIFLFGDHRAQVDWIDNETAKISSSCGTCCAPVYFFDINRGKSKVFMNPVGYSVENNLIAFPENRDKKITLSVSDIYREPEGIISVIRRNWTDDFCDFLETKVVFTNNKKIKISYESHDTYSLTEEEIFFRENPQLAVNLNYKKGYIWFAAEKPPAGMIDTPKESPLCYRFHFFGLYGQLQKLKDKYGAALYDEKITKEPDGSRSLSAKRRDESGKEIVYAYFDDPKSCAEYQTKRLGEAPPVPYYDYGGCVGECCQYNTWTAKEKVVLRKDHSDSSPAVATIEAKEKVDAFTGVVITKQLGKIKVLKDMMLDCGELNLSFKSSEHIYTIHYKGETRYLTWRRGQIYECNIYFEEELLQEVKEEQSEWWAKISTKDGKTGWAREIEKFSNVYSNE